MFIDSNIIINQKDFEDLRNVALCTICQGIVIEPMQCSKCEHCFCKLCLEKWLKQNPKCPFRCENSEFLEHHQIKTQLNILKFKCYNGCDYEIPYKEITEHYLRKCKKIDFKNKYLELKSNFMRLKKKFDEFSKIPDKINKNSFASKYHNHPLIFLETLDRQGWYCNECKKSRSSYVKSYYCTICDYDLCDEFAKKEKLFNFLKIK